MSQLTEMEFDRAGLAHTVVELRSRIEILEGELAESKKIQCDEKLTSSKEIENLERLLGDSEAELREVKDIAVERRLECQDNERELKKRDLLLRRCETKLRAILVRGDFAVVKDQIPIPSIQFLN
jgi:hypothetical protein